MKVDSHAHMLLTACHYHVQARTGGLGNLIIANVYESWVCALNDLCSLGGDFFFCYVFHEKAQKFVSWDQHYKLHLFQSGNLN